MIPIETLWLALIAVFGIIGIVRGIWKELGVTTILFLSLFALQLGWDKIVSKVAGSIPLNMSADTVKALYFIILVSIITFISYEGFTLKFPAADLRGVAKGLVGLPAGFVNGYLVIGTVWDAVQGANYFDLKVWQGTIQKVAISTYLTDLHATLVKYLPLTLMSEHSFILYGFLVLGMLLLLAIVLK